MNRSRRIFWMAMAVAVLHGLIALATTTHRIFYGTVGRANVVADVGTYFQYASEALGGAVPYRDFLVEYPVFAFPLMLLPRLFAPSFARYQIAFGLEMLLANAATLLLVATQVERAEGARRVPFRLAWYTLFFASLCPVTVCRFDLAAMALTFAAAWAWSSGRSKLGGTLAGVGTLVKIVPGVIAAPALIWEVERWKAERGRGMRAFAVALIVGAGAWLALGGVKVWDSLDYHVGRGVEIGSLYSGVLMLTAKATGSALATEYRHSSLEVLAPGSSWAATLGFPMQALALALVMWRSRGARWDETWRYAAAAVLGYVVFGKVLSPQYLIWLFPFMAVLGGRTGLWARGLFLLACLVTTMLYPAGFHWLLLFRGWTVGLLNYRNALLLGLWLLLVFGPRSRARTVPFRISRGSAVRTARARSA